MTCRKVRKLMPLFAGDDLGPRRTRAARSHVDACPDCRTVLEAYRATLRALRTAAKGEGVPDWSEGEWQALMVRAAGETPGSRKGERSAGARSVASAGNRTCRMSLVESTNSSTVRIRRTSQIPNSSIWLTVERCWPVNWAICSSVMPWSKIIASRAFCPLSSIAEPRRIESASDSARSRASRRSAAGAPGATEG